MRNLWIVAVLLASMVTAQNEDRRDGGFGFNQDEEVKLAFWVDPTLEDKGAQFGAGIRKEVLWGYFGAEISHYGALDPNYTDLVGQAGIILNAGQFDILTGARAGVSWRGKNPYPLVGGLLQLDYKLPFSRLEITAGIRLWLDWREDQEDQFYGDADAHTYIVFSNPMLQENGAIIINIKI